MCVQAKKAENPPLTQFRRVFRRKRMGGSLWRSLSRARPLALELGLPSLPSPQDVLETAVV